MQKIGVWGEFICKSYFIHTLFRGKSYFIWRKITLYWEIKQWQHCHLSNTYLCTFLAKTFNTENDCVNTLKIDKETQ